MTNDTSAPTGQEHRSDPELIALVRTGDAAAYEVLFRRHREVARRFALRLAGPERADDIVSESFAKILDLLRRDKGPDVAFRAYLLTTVRTVHLNFIRSGRKESPVADTELQGLTDSVDDDVDARFDEGAIARAFKQLPERWQSALWMTAVEGIPTEEVSKQLGIHSSAVASLAFRARAGLRQAYLAEHLRETADAECSRVIDLLPSFLRGSLSARRRQLVESHLDRCSRCTVAATELADVDRRLGALIAPLVVGGGAATALWPAVAAAPASPATWGVLAGVAQHSGAGIFTGLTAGASATKVVVAASLAAAAFGVSANSLLTQPGTPNDPPTAAGPDQPVAVPTDEVRSPSADPEQTIEEVLPWVTVAGSTTALPTPSSGSTVDAPVAEPGDSGPTSSPTSPTSPTSSAPPTSPPTGTGARAISVAPMTEQKVGHDGRSWHRVSIAVLEPVEDATLRITSTKTMEAKLVISKTSGWICGTPKFTWLDSKFMASTSTLCVYNGRGDGSPVQIDYRVGDTAPVRGLLTPPADCEDTSLLDNVADLLLG